MLQELQGFFKLLTVMLGRGWFQQQSMASATNEEQGCTKTGIFIVLSSSSNSFFIQQGNFNTGNKEQCFVLSVCYYQILTQISELFRVLICSESLNRKFCLQCYSWGGILSTPLCYLWQQYSANLPQSAQCSLKLECRVYTAHL